MRYFLKRNRDKLGISLYSDLYLSLKLLLKIKVCPFSNLSCDKEFGTEEIKRRREFFSTPEFGG